MKTIEKGMYVQGEIKMDLEKEIDEYLNSDGVQDMLITRACIGALADVLISKGLTTEEEIEEKKQIYIQEFVKHARQQILDDMVKENKEEE